MAGFFSKKLYIMGAILIKQHNVNLVPAIGQKDVSFSFPMPIGYVESVVAYTNKNEDYLIAGETRKPNIWLEMKDSSGMAVIPLTPIEHWKQTNGAYKDSFKPLKFQSNKESYTLRMVTDRESTGNLANDINVTVYFNYDQNVNPVSPSRPNRPNR